MKSWGRPSSSAGVQLTVDLSSRMFRPNSWLTSTSSSWSFLILSRVASSLSTPLRRKSRSVFST